MALSPKLIIPSKGYSRSVQQRTNEGLAAPLKELAAKPHMNSHIVEQKTLGAAATTLVEHKLGRKVRGWYVVDSSANAKVNRDVSSTADLTKFLPLYADVETIVDLVVF